MEQLTASLTLQDPLTRRGAVVEGVDRGGRPLSRLMPRYAFARGELAALQAYLMRIGAEQRSGATAASVTFGLPELPGSPGLTEERAVAIRSGLADALGGGTVWERSVEIATFACRTRSRNSGGDLPANFHSAATGRA